eukprot:PhM_4_TR12259/c0_g1_i1/m.101206
MATCEDADRSFLLLHSHDNPKRNNEKSAVPLANVMLGCLKQQPCQWRAVLELISRTVPKSWTAMHSHDRIAVLVPLIEALPTVQHVYDTVSSQIRLQNNNSNNNNNVLFEDGQLLRATFQRLRREREHSTWSVALSIVQTMTHHRLHVPAIAAVALADLCVHTNAWEKALAFISHETRMGNAVVHKQFFGLLTETCIVHKQWAPALALCAPHLDKIEAGTAFIAGVTVSPLSVRDASWRRAVQVATLGCERSRRSPRFISCVLELTAAVGSWRAAMRYLSRLRHYTTDAAVSRALASVTTSCVPSTSWLIGLSLWSESRARGVGCSGATVQSWHVTRSLPVSVYFPLRRSQMVDRADRLDNDDLFATQNATKRFFYFVLRPHELESKPTLCQLFGISEKLSRFEDIVDKLIARHHSEGGRLELVAAHDIIMHLYQKHNVARPSMMASLLSSCAASSTAGGGRLWPIVVSLLRCIDLSSVVAWGGEKNFAMSVLTLRPEVLQNLITRSLIGAPLEQTWHVALTLSLATLGHKQYAARAKQSRGLSHALCMLLAAAGRHDEVITLLSDRRHKEEGLAALFFGADHAITAMPSSTADYVMSEFQSKTTKSSLLGCSWRLSLVCARRSQHTTHDFVAQTLLRCYEHTTWLSAMTAIAVTRSLSHDIMSFPPSVVAHVMKFTPILNLSDHELNAVVAAPQPTGQAVVDTARLAPSLALSSSTHTAVAALRAATWRHDGINIIRTAMRATDESIRSRPTAVHSAVLSAANSRGLWVDAMKYAKAVPKSLLVDTELRREVSYTVSRVTEWNKRWEVCGHVILSSLNGAWDRVLEDFNVLRVTACQGQHEPKWVADTLSYARRASLSRALPLSPRTHTTEVGSALNFENKLSYVASRQQWVAAINMYTRAFLGGVRVRAEAINHVVNACTDSGHWDTALCAASLMSARHGTSELSLMATLRACAAGGAWVRGLRVMDRLKSVRLATAFNPPASAARKVSSSSASSEDVVLGMSACVKAGVWSEALRLFAQNSQKAHRKMYELAMSACTACGMWAHAIALFHHMVGAKSHGPSSNSVHLLLHACEKLRLDCETMTRLVDPLYAYVDEVRVVGFYLQHVTMMTWCVRCQVWWM